MTRWKNDMTRWKNDNMMTVYDNDKDVVTIKM